MKKCMYCGKKSNLVHVDTEEDEEVYLCRQCSRKENKKVKERADNIRGIFGYPSHNRVMKIAKSWLEGSKDYNIDESKSVLPKWLLDKGLMNMYDFLKSRKDIINEIERNERSAKRKNRNKDWKEIDLHMLKRARDDLRNFRIEYFNAADVEKAFAEVMKNEKKE